MTVTLLQGDCLEVMKTLPDRSVQCCISSPPYFGLRDYGMDGQIGLEETPEAYVEKLVAVFREVRRVLKDDGTIFLNLGDSYAGSGGAGGDYSEGGLKEGQPKWKSNFEIDKSKRNSNRWGGGNIPSSGYLKPKDLIGIPWRVAFALQADGWWLRNDIIWAKPNPMPESVTDRCTRSHEYIFLLTKSARYFYDAEAIKELSTYGPGCGWDDAGHEIASKTADQKNPAFRAIQSTRNKRDVWTVTTKPYKGAHFATYPPDLIEPCILAGTSAKGECPHCGKAWIRMVEKDNPPTDGHTESAYPEGTTANRLAMKRQAARERGEEFTNRTTTIGWQPQCDCPEHEPVHQVVLDPFCGSGTTMEVAIRHNRDGIGIELNPKYIQLIKRRLKKVQPFLPMT